MTRFRRLLAIVALAAAGSSPPAAAQTPEGGGVAVLPLRSRGLTANEHRKIAQRIAVSFKQTRPDAIGPEEFAARLSRDARRSGALSDARKLVVEGAERSLNLESAAAVSAYDRALAIWRENFGEWVDPAAMADAYVRRASNPPTHAARRSNTASVAAPPA